MPIAPCMRRFLIALTLAAIAISPGASHSSTSGSSGRSITRSAPRSQRSAARSEGRNSPTGRRESSPRRQAYDGPLHDLRTRLKRKD